MIKVICYKESDKIIGFEVKGHANYDDKGKDIVCSAVSSIVIGGLNAIKNINAFELKNENGFVKLIKKDELEDEDLIVLKTIYIQLKTIETSYPSYIKINERNE